MPRRRAPAARAAGATAGVVLTLLTAMPSGASGSAPRDGSLVLPTPERATLTFPHIGLRPDRRLSSHAPGTTLTSEIVRVGMDGSGAPATVGVDERLRISGTGDYLIYERGPARAAAPVGRSAPPVLELGTVVWQGFSPGRRALAARLSLDPVLEAARLPLRITLSWQPLAGGAPRALSLGGGVSRAGTVTVHLENTTATPRVVPDGIVPAAGLAPPLDRLRVAAARSARRPDVATVVPIAGRELPARLAAAGIGTTAMTAVAPLRVTGTVTAAGTTATLAGPTVVDRPGGGFVDGVLDSTVDFTLQVPRASTVSVDLTAAPVVDPRTVRPPEGAPTWSSWARTSPASTAERRATRQLVVAAADAARAAELSPYVGSDLPGPASTLFRYSLASPAAAAPAPGRLRPKPVAITVAALAGLVVLSALGLVWRRL